MKTFLLWLLAVVITLSSVVYQRLTGPTHPKNGSIEIGGQAVDYELLRSHDTSDDAIMRIEAPENVSGELTWRRYKSHDDWMTESLPREDRALIVRIPKQPSAGKVAYSVALMDQGGSKYDLTEEPVVMRFKDPVPMAVLIPHILFMFSAMLVANRAGLEAMANRKNMYWLSMYATIFLVIGGHMLGPIVQKYAFGAFWTGWPFGHDLTDNKTLIATIFWIIAVIRARKQGKGRAWVIAAAVITLAVYLIPHSVLGSEIDYRDLETPTP